MTITRTQLAGRPAVCHYCRGPIPVSHRHVLAAHERAVFCACPACSDLLHREIRPEAAKPGHS